MTETVNLEVFVLMLALTKGNSPVIQALPLFVFCNFISCLTAPHPGI